jgi:hypothetical protein
MQGPRGLRHPLPVRHHPTPVHPRGPIRNPANLNPERDNSPPNGLNPDSEEGTTKVTKDTKFEEIAGWRTYHKRSWLGNPTNPLFFVKFSVFRGWKFGYGLNPSH